MARLKAEFLERVEQCADRVVEVAEAVARQKRSPRIVDQMIGAGTSVGANVYESDEAVSRADFRKCLGIAAKELSETAFWLRFVARRGWFQAERLAPLQTECTELRRILAAIIKRSR